MSVFVVRRGAFGRILDRRELDGGELGGARALTRRNWLGGSAVHAVATWVD